MNIFKEIKNNKIGISVGLLGIIFAIIFYAFPRDTYVEVIENRELTYKVSDPTVIFDGWKLTEKFELIDKSTREIIDQDLYLVNLEIKNTGNLSIDKEIIRENLEIYLLESEIVDISINAIDSMEVKVGEINDKPYYKNPSNSYYDGNNNFELEWKYFDPEDKITINLVYKPTRMVHHTGWVTEKEDLIIEGKIPGLQIIENK